MISILMATYNGEQFLKEQLDSLLNQTLLPTNIYISDDQSTDNTWNIIKDYQSKHPDLIIATKREENSGSAKYNFMDMMIDIKDCYVMLCDQDDVWLPEKIENTFSKMKELEKEHGNEIPLLVHTDLKVVDVTLDVIDDSYFQMARVEHITSLKQMCLQNNVAGCTTMYNQSLAQKIDKAPDFFVMHDWWLGLVCRAFGKSTIVQEATILYRQHSNNELGASKAYGLKHKLHKLLHTHDIKVSMQEAYLQAGNFQMVYGAQLSENENEFLMAYQNLTTQPWSSRIYTMKKFKLFRKGFFRKLSQVIFG